MKQTGIESLERKRKKKHLMKIGLTSLDRMEI